MHGALGGVPRWQLFAVHLIGMRSASLFVKLTENILSMGLPLLALSAMATDIRSQILAFYDRIAADPQSRLRAHHSDGRAQFERR